MVLLALVVILTGTTLYFALRQPLTDKPIPVSTDNVQTNPAPIQTTTTQYKSSNGFSMDYPKDWRLDNVIDGFKSIVEAQKSSANYFSIVSFSENTFGVGEEGPLPPSEIKIETFVYDNINI